MGVIETGDDGCVAESNANCSENGDGWLTGLIELFGVIGVSVLEPDEELSTSLLKLLGISVAPESAGCRIDEPDTPRSRGGCC